jgi:heat shock protein HtpX
MADTTDVFERRNRTRIVAVVLVATLNYMLAIALAAVAVVVGIVLTILFGLEIFPDDLEVWKWIGIGIAAIAAVSFVAGLLLALIKIPFARRSLERRVLRETGARISQPPGQGAVSQGQGSQDVDGQREVRNLLEGLAIAAGIPAPRFAVIEDPAPNSFGVGTRPANTIIGVTTGLSEHLSRDELEAVLAYEVSRIKGWDIALASWTVALTSGAISAVDGGADSGGDILKAVLGFLPRRFGQWLQVWALRDQGAERDRAAVRFTRNPKSLLHALEKLDADSSQIKRVSRATAPLWVEFPAHVVAGGSKSARRLGKELLLDERIEQLRTLAGEAPPATAAAATP